MTRNSHSTLFTGLVIALCFYLFNLAVPYYSDDWWHAFIHHPHGEYPTQRIENANDLFTSQVNHYLNKNGRLPVTTIAQAIVSTCPKGVFNLLNTAVFVLCTTLLTLYYSTRKVTPARLILSAIALFFFLPGHYDTLMWASGAMYYLWVTAITFIVLHLYRRADTQYSTPLWRVLLLIIGILAGWSNEAISMGLLAGLAVDSLYQKPLKAHVSQYCITGGVAIGVALIVCAPGSWSRTQWVTHSLSNIELYTPLLFALILPLMLCLVLWHLYKHNKPEAEYIMSRYRICIVASLALVPVCIVTWQFAARSCYGMALFAIIPLLSMVDRYILPRFISSRKLQALTIAIVVAYTSALYVEHCKVEKSHRALIELYCNSNDGTVVLDAYRAQWYAQHYTLNIEDEYKQGWTARHMAAYYGKVPMQWLSTELYNLLTHPHTLFTNSNKVQGENELYTTNNIDCYILAPDANLPDSLLYHYAPVSCSDKVPIASKLRRLIEPDNYPTQAVTPNWHYNIHLDQDTFICITKNPYRNVTAIDNYE